ncbi:MAG: hypothetical protein KDB23_12965 [Planctomycetales bacterium]|nr:hypothetical protein [Planctomycetales bacterium]
MMVRFAGNWEVFRVRWGVRVAMAVATISLVGCLVTSTWADEELPTPTPMSRERSANPLRGSRDEVTDVEAAIQRLQAERSKLKARVEATDRAVTHSGSTRARTASSVGEMRDRIERSRQQDLQRSERIREKLDRLRGFIDQGNACVPTGDDNAAPDPTRDQVAEEAPRPPAQADAPPTETQSSPDAPEATLPVTSPGSRFPELPNRQSDDKVQAIPLLDAAVDSLRLANNLYGSNEIKLALDIYQRMDKAGLDQLDQLWVEYQIGNCHRRLGNRQESERAFRIVTSRDKSTWIGENARWWLDVNDRANRLETQIETFKQALDQLQETPNAGSNTP